MELRYEYFDFDEDWSALVNPYFKAWAEERPYDRLEEKVERRTIASPGCRLYAERLMLTLKEKYPQHQFAAYSDPTDWPANVVWRVLVRRPDRKPLAWSKQEDLEEAALDILHDIEQEFPGVAETERAKAEAEQNREAERFAKKIGMTVTYANAPQSDPVPHAAPKPRGCLMRLLWPFR